MKNTNRKGFTIVELVIVIAVIAILAAVLIPTFVGLVNKANVAADTALIKNLNTALAADTDGCKTMHEALEAAAEYGYDVAKINAKGSDNEILWDSVNNVFCYFDSEKGEQGDITYIPDYNVATKPADVDYWVIASTPSEKYSTYLYDYEGDNVTASTGLDVGECEIASITYNGSVNGQEVVIATNNAFGTLTINARNDEVVHYGNIGDVNIVAVKKGSYNEYGRVGGVVTLTYGKINVKENAEITTIIATPENADDVVLNVEGNGTVGAVISTDNAVAEKMNVTGVKATEVVETDAIEEIKSAVCYVKGDTNTYYETFESACNAAENGATVVVMKNYQYNADIEKTLITIASNKNLTIDLNGKTISGILNNIASVSLIKVEGTLTVKDSSNGDGLMTVNAVNAAANPESIAASIISVGKNGVLNFESGNITVTAGARGSYAIDSSSTGTVNITGGKISSEYVAIRSNGTLTLKNAELSGAYSLFMQDGKATIDNAKFTGTGTQMYLSLGGANKKIEVVVTNTELLLANYKGNENRIVITNEFNPTSENLTVTLDGTQIAYDVTNGTYYYK